MSSAAGLGTMLRLAWRRSWVFILCWAIPLVAFMPMTAAQYSTIIPPGSDAAATIEPLRHNPSMLALLGPAYDAYTKGGFVFFRVGGFTTFFIGMMTALLIIRSTRAEEESGRLELVRAGAIGRHAPLLAGVLLSVLASAGIGAVAAALVIASGLPVAGSLAAGLAIASVGWVFTGIGAVLAQVFQSARAARAWTVGIVWGGLFLLRMLVDGSVEDRFAWARWALPIEWGVLLRPWAGDRWWAAALPIGLLIVLTAAAVVLESHRDFDDGFIETRPGRATAPATLSGAWGLAWRLQRGSLIGWTIGLAISAIGAGSIMAQMQSAIDSNKNLGAMLEKLGGTADIGIGFYVALLGILCTVIGVMAALVIGRLRSEETQGRVEPMLATATSRWAMAGSHLVWASVLPALLTVAVGALLPVMQAKESGDWSMVGQYTKAGAAMAPGVLLIAGLAMLLIGWAPRLMGLIWAVVGWSMFASWFSILLDVPEWVHRLTPWGYLPHLPLDRMDWTPVLVETALAIALMAVGLIGYRRRDIGR